MTRCTATLTGRLEGVSRVNVDLAWDSADPYAVTIALKVPGTRLATERTFARHLLACGLTTRQGEGLVTVEPGPQDRIRVTLRSKAGETCVDLDRIPLWLFVQDTEKHVPVGVEDVTPAIDQAIARCFTGR